MSATTDAGNGDVSHAVALDAADGAIATTDGNATTADASGETPPTLASKIKWHPGHYGASGGVARPGDTLSKFSPEIDDMCKDDWIVGYRLVATWAALDVGPFTFTSPVGGKTSGTLDAAPGDGVYWVAFSSADHRSVTVKGTTATWSTAVSSTANANAHFYDLQLIDSILDRLKTKFATPKQLVLTVEPMSFQGGTRASDDFHILPKYLTTDVSSYGRSPDGSSSGWWGAAPGQTTGTYTAALYRPAVADAYAALGAALGAKYDGETSFEAIMDQEPSAVVGNAFAGRNFGAPASNDPSYSETDHVAAMEKYLTVWLSAFPHTSVISENTFLETVTPTQEFEAWMIAHRVAPGTADSSGQSYYDAGHTANSWGQAAYFGITAEGSKWTGPDSRGVARAMMDVEQPDIMGAIPSHPRPVGTSVEDIVDALNRTVKASHAFWCHVAWDATKWAQITDALHSHPLTNVGYPENYPK